MKRIGEIDKEGFVGKGKEGEEKKMKIGRGNMIGDERNRELVY